MSLKTLRTVVVIFFIGACIAMVAPRMSPVIAQSTIAADIDHDGDVDVSDFNLLVADFDKSVSPADINASGKVDIFDFNLLITDFGKTAATPTSSATSPTPMPTSPGGSGITYDQALAWITAYKAAHSGVAADINSKTNAQLASDPAAQQLLSLCGPDQRPVIPQIAYEGTRPWLNISASALVYCVYTPVSSGTSHWTYDEGQGRVTADMYVRFPDQNPCKTSQGKDQVLACLGDPLNTEVLVTTISLFDGSAAGFDLSEASTLINLILPDGTKTQLLLDI